MLAGQGSVLGWGTRWSVTVPAVLPCPPLPQAQISHYADSVAFHLAKILESDKHSVVISSAK